MAKESDKLSATFVEKTTFQQGQNNKHADGGGLYLIITKTGTKRWQLDYRRPITGKQNSISLGVYDKKTGVSLAQARVKRNELKLELAKGIDPAEDRKQSKNAQRALLENTFGKYAEEWLKMRELEGKVDSETIRKLNHDILPYIGKMPVIHLTVEQLERDVTARMVERGVYESARRVKSIMNMVLKLPFKRRIITYNPAPDITLPKPIKGHHKAITNERELGEMLRKIWQLRKISPRTHAGTEIALKLSVNIFQRPNEIRGLLWDEVDFEKHQLSFVASKTHQEHIVPLSRQAFDLLKQAEELRTTSKFVFPSCKTNKECLSTDTIRQALNRLGYGGKQTHHGFRATARTLTDEEMEFSMDAMEHQLAHKVKDSNGRAYNRTTKLRRRRQLMQLWSDYLDTLRQGGDISVFKPQDLKECNEDENFKTFQALRAVH